MIRLRLKPSPSMVVASIALLVALSGTAVATVATVPRASVGTPQLKNNAVTSLKVKNRSLRAIDFARGQLPRGPVGPAGPPGAPGPSGPAGPAGPAGAAGIASPGYVAEVLSATSNSTSATTSTSYNNLPNGSLSVTVPSGETDKLVVLFSGESACYGGDSLQRCRLRVNVDGNELSPSAGGDAYFDNNNLGLRATGVSGASVTNSFNSKSSGDVSQHAIVRVSGNLSAGSHTVQVQISTTDSSTAFEVDDWALVVQRIKVS
jgi:hypothetical protein